MRISFKLLILMVCISLLPIILLRSLGQHTMNRLGQDLASETRNLLIRKAGDGLKSLVEEHAKILKRERDLIEMALQVQVSELERRYAETMPQERAAGGHHGLLRQAGQKIAGPAPAPHHMPSASDTSLKVDDSRQRFIIPPDLDRRAAARDIERLSDMTSVFQALQRKHADLIIWQITALDNGLQSIFPSMGRLPMMYHAFQKQWYRRTFRQGGVNWSPPGSDPFTRQLAFVVSKPLHLSDGSRFGVTAIVVPVNVLLHEDDHMRAVSGRTASYIVRPGKAADDKPLGVKVIARKDHSPGRHFRWRATKSVEWLKIGGEEQARQLAQAMSREAAGVREIDHQGLPSIAAFGRIDAYGTTLLLIIPKEEVTEDAVSMEQYVIGQVKDQIEVTRVLLLLVVALVIGISFLLSRTLTRNIQKMVQVVRRIASGDFTARVEITTRDEMGELGRTLNAMVPDLAERVQMKQGLDLAREIQHSLLPKGEASLPGLDVAGTIAYCDQTGGDFYDFLDLCCREPHVSGIVVGDVSDHGVSATLLMASARAFLRSRVTKPGGMAEYINDVNQLVIKDTLATNQFLTLFYLEIDPDRKSLSWVRAGHEPAILYDPAADRFTWLRGVGPALGVDENVVYEENHQSGLARGQIILLATDGVWDTRNPEGEMFGRERVNRLVRQHAARSSRHLMNAILEALNRFRGASHQEDDITLVVIKLTGAIWERGSSR